MKGRNGFNTGKGLDKAALTALALDAIQRGAMPFLDPVTYWGGHGTGAICPVCGERVEHEGVEIEVDFSASVRRGSDRPAAYHLHPLCCSAWDAARRHFVASIEAGGSMDPAALRVGGAGGAPGPLSGADDGRIIAGHGRPSSSRGQR